MRYAILLLALAIIPAACKKRPNQEASDVLITNGKKIESFEYPAVVKLLLWNDEGSKVRSFCTGTFISRGVVITAAHCIRGKADANGFVKAKTTIEETGEESRVAMRHPSHDNIGPQRQWDIALVIFKEQAHRSWLPLGPQTPAVGSPVTMVGYGVFSSDKNKVGVKRLGTNKLDSIDNEGMLRVVGTAYASGADGTAIDSTADQGDSGGPLFHDGKVVGICSSGHWLKNSSERKYTSFVDLVSSENRQALQQLRSTLEKHELPTF